MRVRQALRLQLAILLAIAANGWGRSTEEEVLIGWQGETYQPKHLNSTSTTEREDQGQVAGAGKQPDDARRPWIQTLSWRPRAFVYHNFLSLAEVNHILELAKPQMRRSMVEGPNHTGVVDNVRTSAGMFIMRNYDPVITAIEERLSAWTHLPRPFQEDMQVLRYGPTNKYGAHIDGLGRVMSILMYLVPPEEGGETAFPQSRGWQHPEMGEPAQGQFSDCAKQHVAYKPKVGDALMFYDRTPDYLSEDPSSEHTGCPVIKGVKWNAVKWIHGEVFHPEEWAKSIRPEGYGYETPHDPGICLDYHEQCQEWADMGECENNAGYMIGMPDGVAHCRRACKHCRVCEDGDTQCIKENREAGGFISFDEGEFDILKRQGKFDVLNQQAEGASTA